jgi:sarcosine oxidase gamma subunit
MAIVGLTSLFAIMAPSDDPKLEAAIQAKFPADQLKVGPGQWIIAATGTSKDISDQLGLTEGDVGSAIIVSFSGYYGRASTNIWEWIASRMGARSG